jgi:hypothetical protein
VKVFQEIDFSLSTMVSQLLVVQRARASTHLNHSKLALGQIRQPDLLHCHSFTCAPIESFIDRAKSSLSETLAQAL